MLVASLPLAAYYLARGFKFTILDAERGPVHFDFAGAPDQVRDDFFQNKPIGAQDLGTAFEQIRTALSSALAERKRSR